MKLNAIKVFVVFWVVGLFLTNMAYAEEKAVKDKYPKYVGSTKCDGSCHDPWYKAWKDSPHGKTYELLKKGVKVAEKKKAGLEDKDYTTDPKCLRCHTTGYGEKGGYEVGMPISPDEPNLENVGCEMCHTARGGSITRVTMKEEKKNFKRTAVEKEGLRYDFENVCKKCHGHKHTPFTEKVDPKHKFDFKERVKKVHDYKKYYNADNKDQKIEGDHGKGETETKPLAVDDWEIVDGEIKFKVLPMVVKDKVLVQVFQ